MSRLRKAAGAMALLLVLDVGAVRAQLTDLFAGLSGSPRRTTIEGMLHPVAGTALALPFEVADYVDFYASEQHATNLGRLFRPDA